MRFNQYQCVQSKVRANYSRFPNFSTPMEINSVLRASNIWSILSNLRDNSFRKLKRRRVKLISLKRIFLLCYLFKRIKQNNVITVWNCWKRARKSSSKLNKFRKNFSEDFHANFWEKIHGKKSEEIPTKMSK